MIRERSHIYFKDLAGWNLGIEATTEGNKIAKSRGWPTSSAWTLVSGPFNEIVTETDYPDLNTYQRIAEESLADAEWLATLKPAMEAMAVERCWNELLTPAEASA